jgi:hypothetical protein
VNKINTSKKSTDCPVKLTVQVKKVSFITYWKDLKINFKNLLQVNRNTIKNDSFLDAKLNNGVVRMAKITIHGLHNHNIDCADALRFNRVSDCLKQTFFELFADGCSPSQAKKLHEERLMANDSYLTDLADGAKNPTKAALYHLHSVWTKTNFGDQNLDPLAKIKDKIDSGYYRSRGIWLVMIMASDPLNLNLLQVAKSTLSKMMEFGQSL